MLKSLLFRSALALTCLSLAAAADDYEIKFDRPMKVGDRYRVTCKGSQVQVSKVQAGDKVIPDQRQAREGELQAAVEVLAVSPKGKPQKVRLTETKFTGVADGQPATTFPDGTEVVAEYASRKTSYFIGGRPAEDKVGKMLAIVFRLAGDETADDAMFGTKERKKVSQRWSIDAEAAAAALSSSIGSKFDAKAVQGGCTLDAIVSSESGPALRILGDLTISDFQVPIPGGLRIRKGKVSSRLVGVFPVDTAKGVAEQEISTITEIEAEGTNNGVKLDVSNRGEESRTVRYSYK